MNEVVLTGSTAVIISSFTNTLQSFTVVRLRGLVSISPATLGETHSIGAFGIIKVTPEAFAIGLTAIPTPWTDSGDDGWIFHSYYTVDQRPGTGSVTNMLSLSRDQIVIDSKAMRKVDQGEVLISVLENGSTDGISFMENHRTLIKLH